MTKSNETSLSETFAFTPSSDSSSTSFFFHLVWVAGCQQVSLFFLLPLLLLLLLILHPFMTVESSIVGVESLFLCFASGNLTSFFKFHVGSSSMETQRRRTYTSIHCLKLMGDCHGWDMCTLGTRHFSSESQVRNAWLIQNTSPK